MGHSLFFSTLKMKFREDGFVLFTTPSTRAPNTYSGAQEHLGGGGAGTHGAAPGPRGCGSQEALIPQGTLGFRGALFKNPFSENLNYALVIYYCQTLGG